MDKWIKENKITVAIFVVVTIVLGMGYREGERDIFAKRQHCADLGNKYAEKELKDFNYSDGRSSNVSGTGEYVYSAVLDTCLYSNNDNFNTPGVSRASYYIVDLSTNQKIVGYTHWYEGGGDYNVRTSTLADFTEFEKIYKQNFTPQK